MSLFPLLPAKPLRSRSGNNGGRAAGKKVRDPIGYRDYLVAAGVYTVYRKIPTPPGGGEKEYQLSSDGKILKGGKDYGGIYKIKGLGSRVNKWKIRGKKR